MRQCLFLTVIFISAFACAQNAPSRNNKIAHEPPALGVHWAKDAPGQAKVGPGTPDMLWHNGPIMSSAAVKVIYWGASWSDSAFVGDKITGLESWYLGFNRSNYAKTSDEYTGTNGQVTPAVSYGGYIKDFSKPSSGNQTSGILAEVCSVIKDPVPNGYYPVYVDKKRDGGYCAYHSYGSCGSTPVQFAFFFNLDGDAGCDPEDTQTGHSQGLAALANVSGHELSEARTDPRFTGWYDAAGAENGDKCAWTFNVPFVSFSNRSIWKIQGEWSNAAYDGGTGYPNRAGQNGCLDGQ